MQLKQHLPWIWIALTILAANVAFAAPSDPMELLETTSDKMLSQLQANKASLKTKPQIVYNIINKTLLPHVDTVGMSRAVLGRQVWNQASSAEQKRFVSEFTQLLVRTYATALAAYEDQEVKFLPLRGGVGNKTRLQIDSLILQSKGPQIPVSYRLILLGGNWKVYDLNVDGVSLLQSYRSQFSREISQNGLSTLLDKLEKQNNEQGK